MVPPFNQLVLVSFLYLFYWRLPAITRLAIAIREGQLLTLSKISKHYTMVRSGADVVLLRQCASDAGTGG